MFDPINLPPSEHHQFSTGHSTEYGDNAMTVGEKINAGFKHVYSVLAGMGASLSDEVEYVAKSEFDLLVHELEEAKAELKNLKMIVQGLGFAGIRPAGAMLGGPVNAIIDPSAMHLTDGAAVGLSWAGLTGSSEPVVTMTDASGKELPADTVIPADTEIAVTVKEADAQ